MNMGPIYYVYSNLESEVRGGAKCKRGINWFTKGAQSLKIYFRKTFSTINFRHSCLGLS